MLFGFQCIVLPCWTFRLCCTGGGFCNGPCTPADFSSEAAACRWPRSIPRCHPSGVYKQKQSVRVSHPSGCHTHTPRNDRATFLSFFAQAGSAASMVYGRMFSSIPNRTSRHTGTAPWCLRNRTVLHAHVQPPFRPSAHKIPQPSPEKSSHVKFSL